MGVFAGTLLCCEILSIVGILAGKGSYQSYSRQIAGHFCHQIPSRCLWVGGVPTTLCLRCIGMYSGIIVGPAILSTLPGSKRRAASSIGWVLVGLCVVEYFVDSVLPFAVGTTLRWLTGLGLGFGCMTLLRSNYD